MSDLLTVLAIIGSTALVCFAWNGVIWLGDWIARAYRRRYPWKSDNAIPSLDGQLVLDAVFKREGEP